MAELAALQRWHDLAAGRLMFLDYVDSDTRRFIVCLRVHEPLQSNLALAAGERVTLERMLMGQSNKLIASELGVSCASISERIQRALRKLGARSLSELSVVLRSRRSLVFSDWMLGGEGFVALGFREDFAASLGSLSKSELVVLQELLLDRSQREIAFARGVALRTVANQVGSIYRKLRVSGRRELMAKLAAQ
jgi:DNA-binding NarL/FixJ family response regulator